MSDRTAGRTSLLLSLVAVGAVLLLLLERESPTRTPPAAARIAPSAGTPAGIKAAGSDGETPFWSVIQKTRGEAGTDSGEQSGLIEDRLRKLSPQAIVAYDRDWRTLDRKLYTWKVWGAASVIEDGCSDDCFRDFRAYLISLGRATVQQALRDPDGLASIVQDAERGDWENADNAAPEAYSGVTGNDYPLGDSEPSGQPTGTPINLDEANLRVLYPRLAARFRG